MAFYAKKVKVIVRSNMFGVIYGSINEIVNKGATKTLLLENARQMWRWKAKDGVSLMCLAHSGVKEDECIFSPVIEYVAIDGECQIIVLPDDGVVAAQIESVPAYCRSGEGIGCDGAGDSTGSGKPMGYINSDDGAGLSKGHGGIDGVGFGHAIGESGDGEGGIGSGEGEGWGNGNGEENGV